MELSLQTFIILTVALTGTICCVVHAARIAYKTTLTLTEELGYNWTRGKIRAIRAQENKEIINA